LANSPQLVGFAVNILVSAETVLAKRAISGVLSLGRQIAVPRCSMGSLASARVGMLRDRGSAWEDRLMPNTPPFEHPDFDCYDFENVLLDRDIYLMDEKWMTPYAAMMNAMWAGGGYKAVGYVSYAAARSLSATGIELSWYANVTDRFHELRVFLPRDQYVRCVGSWQFDEKPRAFVRGAWITNLHLRANSIYVLVDAIGVKEALRKGAMERRLLSDCARASMPWPPHTRIFHSSVCRHAAPEEQLARRRIR